MPNLKYGTYDEDAAQEEKEELASQGAEFMKLKVGRNIVRILPPAPGKRSPFRTVFQHYIEMPGGAQSVVCSRLEARKPCAVCMKIDELRKSKNEHDHKAASDMYARRRIFVNVIDRGDPDKGVKVLGIGKGIHEKLVALRTDPDAGGDYVHPEKGLDVIITRVGTGKNDTKYDTQLARKESPLGDSVAQMQEWIDTQHNLDAYAKLKSVEEVHALLSGEDPDADVAEEAAPPKGRTATAAPTKRRTVEDDAIDTTGEEVDA